MLHKACLGYISDLYVRLGGVLVKRETVKLQVVGLNPIHFVLVLPSS